MHALASRAIRRFPLSGDSLRPFRSRHWERSLSETALAAQEENGVSAGADSLVLACKPWGLGRDALGLSHLTWGTSGTVSLHLLDQPPFPCRHNLAPSRLRVKCLFSSHGNQCLDGPVYPKRDKGRGTIGARWRGWERKNNRRSLRSLRSVGMTGFCGGERKGTKGNCRFFDSPPPS